MRCVRDTPSYSLPVVTTDTISNITQLSAGGGGNVIVTGSTSLLAKGVCWSNVHNPTVNDKKTDDGNSTGSFTTTLDTLLAYPTYYVRAYAITTQLDTVYGNEVSFNTLPDSSFTDPRDGQVYTFRHIGTQVWMTKNLNYVTDSSWCYDNNSANCTIYGRLYNWYDAMIAAPPGWHLPSDAEWQTLVDYLGGDTIAGGKMKEAGAAHWANPNTGANNSCGFTGLPGGYRYDNGTVYGLGNYGYWWSSTETWSGYIWRRSLGYYQPNVSRYDFGKTYGMSVRCVRD